MPTTLMLAPPPRFLAPRITRPLRFSDLATCLLPDPSIPVCKCELVDLYFVYKFCENSKFVFRESMW